jgi:hypothetical protein
MLYRHSFSALLCNMPLGLPKQESKQGGTKTEDYTPAFGLV